MGTRTRAGRIVRVTPFGAGHRNHAEVFRQVALVNALIARFSQDEEGQGLAEYALILALIAIVAIVALIFLGSQVSDILHTVGSSI